MAEEKKPKMPFTGLSPVQEPAGYCWDCGSRVRVEPIRLANDRVRAFALSCDACERSWEVQPVHMSTLPHKYQKPSAVEMVKQAFNIEPKNEAAS